MNKPGKITQPGDGQSRTASPVAHLCADHDAFARAVAVNARPRSFRRAALSPHQANCALYDELSARYSSHEAGAGESQMIYRLLARLLPNVYLRLLTSLNFALMLPRDAEKSTASQTSSSSRDLSLSDWRRLEERVGLLLAQQSVAQTTASTNYLDGHATSDATRRHALARDELASLAHRLSARRVLVEKDSEMRRESARLLARLFARDRDAAQAARAARDAHETLSPTTRAQKRVLVTRTHTDAHAQERILQTLVVTRHDATDAGRQGGQGLARRLETDAAQRYAEPQHYVERQRHSEQQLAAHVARASLLRRDGGSEELEHAASPARLASRDETRVRFDAFLLSLNLFGRMMRDDEHDAPPAAASLDYFGQNFDGRFLRLSNASRAQALDQLALASAARLRRDARQQDFQNPSTTQPQSLVAHARRPGAEASATATDEAKSSSRSGIGRRVVRRTASGDAQAGGAASSFESDARRASLSRVFVTGRTENFLRSLASFLRSAGDWRGSTVSRHDSSTPVIRAGDAQALTYRDAAHRDDASTASENQRAWLPVETTMQTTHMRVLGEQGERVFVSLSSASRARESRLVEQARAQMTGRLFERWAQARRPAGDEALQRAVRRAAHAESTSLVNRILVSRGERRATGGDRQWLRSPLDGRLTKLLAHHSDIFLRAERSGARALHWMSRTAKLPYVRAAGAPAPAGERTAGERLEDEATARVGEVVERLVSRREEVVLRLPRLSYVFARAAQPNAGEHKVVEKKEQQKELAEMVKTEVQTLMRGAAIQPALKLSRSDYATIADQVYSALTRRLLTERERLGLHRR